MSKEYNAVYVVGEQLIGDMLMHSPAFRGLRAKYPNSKICYCSNEGSLSSQLATRIPSIDKVYTEPEGRVLRTKKDKVIFMNMSSAHQTALDKKVSYCEAVCRNFDVEFDSVAYEFELTPDEISAANLVKQDLISDAEKAFNQTFKDIVICGRHSRSCTSNDPLIKSPNKCFDNKVWCEVADYMMSLGYLPVAVGSKEDERDETYQDWSGVKLYGQPLLEVSALCGVAKLTISVDTGIRHLAAAVGCNLITASCSGSLPYVYCEPKTPDQKIQEFDCPVAEVSLDKLKPLLDNIL